MTETKKIDLPLETEEQPQTDNSIREEDIQVGYFVGISQAGEIVFRTMGGGQDIASLKSVHAFAGSKLEEAELQARSRNHASLTRMLQLLNNSVQSINGQLGFLDAKFDELSNNMVEKGVVETKPCSCDKDTSAE